MQTAEGEIKISNLDWEQRYRIIFSEHDAFGGFITSEHDGKVRQDKVSSRTEHRFSPASTSHLQLVTSSECLIA
jgi:hypothetical protein